MANDAGSGLREALRELCDAIGEEDLERAQTACDCASEVTHNRVDRALGRARALASLPEATPPQGLRERIVAHLNAAKLTQARLIIEGLWPSSAPAPSTARREIAARLVEDYGRRCAANGWANEHRRADALVEALVLAEHGTCLPRRTAARNAVREAIEAAPAPSTAPTAESAPDRAVCASMPLTETWTGELRPAPAAPEVDLGEVPALVDEHGRWSVIRSSFDEEEDGATGPYSRCRECGRITKGDGPALHRKFCTVPGDRAALLSAVRSLVERARREGREEAARYVEAQIGTFQGAGGPVKMVDGALRFVAKGLRALTPSVPGAAPQDAEARLAAFLERYQCEGVGVGLGAATGTFRWRRRYADGVLSDIRTVEGPTLDSVVRQAEEWEAENDRREPQHAVPGAADEEG